MNGTGLRLSASGLTNLRSGAPLGGSQVTAVVRNSEPYTHLEGRYEVAIVAELVAPYIVRLDNPVLLDAEMRRLAVEEPYIVAARVANMWNQHVRYSDSPELPFNASLVG